MTYHDNQNPPRAYSALPPPALPDEPTAVIGRTPPPDPDRVPGPRSYADGDDVEAPAPDSRMRRSTPQRHVDWGVQPGMYAGGVVATAVVVGLLAWIVSAIANLLYRLPGEAYWIRNGYATTPTMGVALWVTAAVVATLGAAGVVWLLTARTPSSGTFITLIGATGLVLGAVLVGLHGGTATLLWQTGIGNAGAVFTLGVAATTGLYSTARTSTTHPERF